MDQLSVLSTLVVAITLFALGVRAEERPATNPILWADVPDVAVSRVGETYYMSSTTMHMSPGLPIMKSTDLVNWSLLGYAYDTLEPNDKLNLTKGQNAYGAGSWASSLRFHDGVYYVSTFSSTTGKTHVFTTRDIEKGEWKEAKFPPVLHDHSLFFDDDGRVYMVYGAGQINLIELTADASASKPGAYEQSIIRNASLVAGANVGLPAEGSQLQKIDGKYYLFNITWPRGDMRTQIVHRADKITGPYEGKVFLRNSGVAQGCLIDTPAGKWYAMLFQDHGAVGRTPFLLPVKWEDGWPVAVDEVGPISTGVDVPSMGLANIVASDDFERADDFLTILKAAPPREDDYNAKAFPPAWQWNHNPDNRFWSLTDRPGWLRLTTGALAPDVLAARNTLTQRTFGPTSAGSIRIDVSSMRDGDVAGLIALQKVYGFVGVRQTGTTRSIVMVGVKDDFAAELASLPLDGNAVHLKIECDFRNRADTAYFFHSMDGSTWTPIGPPLKMQYTLPHFMGYRFGLFNFATKATGGFVDFDYFDSTNQISQD